MSLLDVMVLAQPPKVMPVSSLRAVLSHHPELYIVEAAVACVIDYLVLVVEQTAPLTMRRHLLA
jgi:hypothetical protein